MQQVLAFGGIRLYRRCMGITISRNGPLSPFGELLRRHRLSAGLSQEQLAERAGISLAAVNTLERGVRRAPYLQTVMQLADALALAGTDRAAFEAAASVRRLRTRAAAPFPQRAEAKLPVYLTSFIGRAAEVAECGALLRTHRLVTIVGAGGIGKTRLATAVAESVAAEYQRVIFIDLARATNDDLFALQIAAAFCLDAVSDAKERVATALGDTPALIVLDNCEHVIEAASCFAATLLRRCPNVRILATSRERLAIGGEQVFRARPMDAAAALELFIQRGRGADPHFAIGDPLLAEAEELCRRLDGLPLAIELAAARLPSLGLSELRRRIDMQPGLPGLNRDAPDRHRTIEATIAWSDQLLDEAERALLARASIFVGGFTLEAAECVCSDDALPRSDVGPKVLGLIEKSMLQVVPGATTRYRFLEPVRAYGLQRLAANGDVDRMAQRHAEWFAEVADAANDESRWSYDADSPPERIFVEQDNIRAALDRLLSTDAGGDDDVVLAARIVGGLRSLWVETARYNEGERWARGVLERLDQQVHPELAARVLRLMMQCSSGDAASAALEQIIPLLQATNDVGGLANAYLHRLLTEIERGELDRAKATVEAVTALLDAEPSLPSSFRAWAMAMFGLYFAVCGDFDRARASVERSEHLARTTHGLALSAEIAAIEGDYEQARTLAAEALSLGPTLGSKDFWIQTPSKASFELLAGDVEAAAASMRDAFTLRDASGEDPTALAPAFFVIATIAAKRDISDSAATLVGYAEALPLRKGQRGPVSDRMRAMLQQMLMAALPPARLERLRRDGRDLSHQAAIALAMTIKASCGSIVA
jgi:predicted ATPase/transcriptional regulator with XRE-family HTH domain